MNSGSYQTLEVVPESPNVAREWVPLVHVARIFQLRGTGELFAEIWGRNGERDTVEVAPNAMVAGLQFDADGSVDGG